MRIILASDENYFPYIYVSVLTLFESNKNEDYIVTYIYQDVGKEYLRYLKELGEKNSRWIELIEFEMPDIYKALPSYAASKTTYAKFLFASLFPDDDVVLYLDPDTIIMRSIKHLINYDMEDSLIAGVPECLPKYHREASNMSVDDVYVNGGMVLCNLKEWRRTGFERKALNRLADTRLNLNYDQGILNELCSKKIKVLHARYNVLAEMFEFKSANKLRKRYNFMKYYSQETINDAITSPVIIHFTAFFYGKPLSKNCTHPYASFFQDKLCSCPWEVILSNDHLNRKQSIRKWVLDNMPFSLYLLLERILDVRRMVLLRKGLSR